MIDRLELHEVSPKLPHGYFTMIGLVILRGAHARRLLAAELERSSTAVDPPIAPGARLQVED